MLKAPLLFPRTYLFLNKPWAYTGLAYCRTYCYKVMQDFMVTGLFAGQHNTKLHGTITGVIFANLGFWKI